ncbi:cobalt transporter subunit CbtA [Agrobacterium rubi TR3 = NBRC 13261]|uniref:Cobalt transporter subunit CbtA n=1 Tax=Agrobacterium rubi TR3 = NBRC 13261 TaxID=1368415 RepID=A0A081CYF9_9HYPH|nr:CbtA family protein [Agrobacterium rubi]MBP1879928.1 cobalt transporter subunit CbtA [Agrobacterium rubi]MCL6653990.1 cobalt transporter [Agrobacterium rubi]GAK71705.1 cobalt transporter subunit CbtA [Agrobacterium rubi TR3 = NBRC 13261]
MPFFRNIVFTAVLVGLIAGLAVSALQAIGTTPLILQAETFENAGGEAAPAHAHDAATPADHHHDTEAWAPADGFERNAYTLAANVLTAIGYALVLTALISLRSTQGGWREGLFWGLAGFAAVMLAPMIGLPPELPGSPAAALEARQIWWVATVAATSGGIALLAFKRNEPWAIILAVVLIVAPHIVGAPLPPEGEHALAPLPLERRFMVLATVTSFVFWLILGSLSGLFLKRFDVAR